MKILVTGSREYAHRWRVRDVLQSAKDFARAAGSLFEVIVGDCPTGADEYAREWCSDYNTDAQVFEADWGAYGKRAGPIRNLQMVTVLAGFATAEMVCVVAFLEPGAGNRGTQNTVDLARQRGLIVHEIHG